MIQTVKHTTKPLWRGVTSPLEVQPVPVHYIAWCDRSLVQSAGVTTSRKHYVAENLDNTQNMPWCCIETISIVSTENPPTPVVCMSLFVIKSLISFPPSSLLLMDKALLICIFILLLKNFLVLTGVGSWKLESKIKENHLKQNMTKSFMDKIIQFCPMSAI